jgi:hypothetical protein
MHYLVDALDYGIFGLCPSSGIIKSTALRKLDAFPFSGEVVRDNYSVGCVRKSQPQLPNK